MSTVSPGPPVYAGLCVSNLVETGDLEPIGVASLAFVHEVAEGQHHLQNLSQTLAPDHLPGCVQDGWKMERENDRCSCRDHVVSD